MANSILRNPRLFLALFTLLVFAVVTRGGFSDADTSRRLQVTHWMWSSAPQVAVDERGSSPGNPSAAQLASAPGFCDLTGANGETYAQFSIGQSLLMLPADIATAFLRGEFKDKPANFFLHNWAVNLVTFPPIAVAGVVLSFELLTVLGFAVAPALAASVFLLMGTTFVLYIQDSAENSQLYALHVGALVALLKSDRARIRRNMLIAGACAGAGLLLKLPFIANVAALGLVAKYASDRAAGDATLRGFFRFGSHTLRDAALFALPVAACLGVDRAYHFYRFAEVTGTYMKHCIQAFAKLGGYPENYPFGFPLLKGMAGPLFDSRRSVFLFDPFLAVALGFIVAGWRGMSVERRLTIASALLAFVLLLVIFGGSWYWNGGIGSWGARHHLVPIQLLCLVGFALAIERLSGLGAMGRTAVAAGAGASILAQALALPIGAGVEEIQAIQGDPLRFIPLLRARNLYYIATDRAGELAANLTDPAARDMATDLLNPFTPNRFFFLRIARYLDPPDSTVATGLWILLALLAAGGGLWALWTCARRQLAPDAVGRGAAGEPAR